VQIDTVINWKCDEIQEGLRIIPIEHWFIFEHAWRLGFDSHGSIRKLLDTWSCGVFGKMESSSYWLEPYIASAMAGG